MLATHHLSTVLKTTRPPFLILSPICIFLGLAIARYFYSEISTFNAVLVMIAALCAHISVNTFNEYFDFKSGLDNITEKTPFSGGSGGLPGNPNALPMVLMAAVTSLLATIVIGLYLVSISSPYLLVLGLLGVATIVFYTQHINRMPWLCLVSPGLGFGVLFVVGAYISVLPNSESSNITNFSALSACIWASFVPYFLVNNLLLLNQFPDVEADKIIGRRTLPIVYGKPFALNIFLFQSLACAAFIAVGPFITPLPITTLIALFPVLIISIAVYKEIKNSGFKTEQLNPALGKNVICTLVTTLVYGLGVVMGLFF